MLISNMFIYESFYGKKKTFKNMIVDQMDEIVKIQIFFLSNYLICWFKFFYRCVDFGRKFNNETYLFSLDKKDKI